MTERHSPLGFVGFGEAAFHIARGLRGAGAPPLAAFDINTWQGAQGERIRARAAETGTSLVESPESLALAAPTILSLVTAASALDAAASIAPSLTASHLFVDLNSVSPATKRDIAASVGAGAGRFVEGAIMAPVPGADHRVPILLNGPSANALADVLSPYDMRLEVMDGEPGSAAAVKMCRSIVIKGLEALLLECALAAGQYGASDRVFESLADTFPSIDWRQTSHYLVGRVLQHGERRAREMDEVAAMLRASGIEPIMAEATSQRQDWESRLRQVGRLSGGRPETIEGLLDLLVSPPPTARVATPGTVNDR